MKALVVSAHPDDETLGAGGTILKLKASGSQVHWLNFTDKSEKYGYKIQEVRKRQKEIETVEKVYKFDSFTNFSLPPAGLGQCSKHELVNETKRIIARIKPDTLFLPFREDPHSDHRIVFETVFACTKTFQYPFIKEVLMMEILSETEFSRSDKGFVPNYFVDIFGYLEKKIEIMKNYKSELGKHPFPRSIDNIRALAMHRGVTAGCRFAESFMLLKKIIR